MYDRILIPNDGSDKTEEAIKEGIELAKLTGAELHTIFVVNIATFENIPETGVWNQTKGILEKEGEAANKEVERKCEDQGVKCKSKILSGKPHTEILDYAKKNKIDLIVMGTTSKKGVDKFLLGSVAEKVLRSSESPVMVVRSK
ncbi:Nucleotide-binding protein UspA family [Methanonatronarchaeum thermophilum]|uniref:Nucleotide-binding protein UspA family n=1 Tax=Methanonatronarchaeum thermophilum TaxID=1927129 RepID=A0A1Y3G9M1_9EURY|nr:universal stress protein [Methanonatronarchaeum thermophilum]OUJ18128.1 Nucleotide-binding protein UspA family [Methanonatronarchaeum thermophilum]